MLRSSFSQPSTTPAVSTNSAVSSLLHQKLDSDTFVGGGFSTSATNLNHLGMPSAPHSSNPPSATTLSSSSTPTSVFLSAPNFNRTKAIACPSCRKPLPRCSICLLHMGQPLDVPSSSKSNYLDAVANTVGVMKSLDEDEDEVSGFDLWFSWCQACRHGGHAIHLLHWFRKHKVCPVSDCSCQCQGT